LTFKDVAGMYLAGHAETWKSVKHRQQWKNSLATYAYPILGDLAVADITTAHIIKVLEGIWKVKPETASRVRSRIEAVLGYATVRDLRVGDNPARWRHHLQGLLPAKGKVRKVKHHAALPYSEMAQFMSELRARDSLSARALEFTILTAARTGETTGVCGSRSI